MSEWISVKQRMPEEYAYCMLGGLAGVAEGFHFKAGAKECWKFTRVEVVLQQGPVDSEGNKLVPCGQTLQFVGSPVIYKCLQRPGHEGRHGDGKHSWYGPKPAEGR